MLVLRCFLCTSVVCTHCVVHLLWSSSFITAVVVAVTDHKGSAHSFGSRPKDPAVSPKGSPPSPEIAFSTCLWVERLSEKRSEFGGSQFPWHASKFCVKTAFSLNSACRSSGCWALGFIPLGEDLWCSCGGKARATWSLNQTGCQKGPGEAHRFLGQEQRD